MSTMSVHRQRMSALQQAQKMRLAATEIKRGIFALPYDEGCELVSDLLQHPSQAVLSVRVGHLLTSIRGVGPRSAQTWLTRADVRSQDRQVRQLSDRQRLELANVVRKGRTW